jgi:hypothetical protein
MGQASTIGLDIAKRGFQAHGTDASGHVVFRPRRRGLAGQQSTRSRRFACRAGPGVANQFARRPGFEQRGFAIDWDRERVTCLRGQISVLGAQAATTPVPHASKRYSAAPTAAPVRPGRNARHPRMRVVLSSTPGIRGAECGTGADAQACMEEALRRASRN